MTSKNSSKKIYRNVLILGKGYIGTELAHHLSKIGDVNVFHISRSDIDYHDGKTLRKYIFNNEIGYAINCSGFTGRPNVDEGEIKSEECWNLNVVVPLRISILMEAMGVRYTHISSGCIYTGYERIYTEKDNPNFGLFDVSSFYSKSKHAFETLVGDLNLKILRIRMPICYNLTNPRNYLKKIMEYPNLINYKNSKTLIPELCLFVQELLTNDNINWYNGCDIYNVVNPDPLTTMEVVDHLNYMNEGNWIMMNPNWVKIEDLHIVAPRSNCILDNTKADNIFKLSPEKIAMNKVCNYNNGIQGI